MKSTSFYQSFEDCVQDIYFAKNVNGFCPNHFHRKIEILYNLKGLKTVNINFKNYYLNPNNLVISDSYDAHAYPEKNDSSQILLIIPLRYMELYQECTKNKQLKSNVITDTKIAKSIYKDIIEFENIKNFTPLHIYGLVNTILGKIIEYVGLKNKNKNNIDDLSIAKEILEFCDNNYMYNITLNTISEHFGYSTYYFSKLFHSIFNTNLNDYIGALRIAKTLNYLKVNKTSVTEAATACGFNSMNTFYRMKRKTDMAKYFE